MLHVRRVLEDAIDFDAALGMLAKQTLTTGGLFTLVGTTNEQRVVIERGPRRHALRWAKKGEALVTTNDYRLLDRPGGRDDGILAQTSCDRFSRLCDLTAGRSGKSAVEDEEMLYWLTDEHVQQSITAQHVLIRPARNEMRLFVPKRLLKSV